MRESISFYKGVGLIICFCLFILFTINYNIFNSSTSQSAIKTNESLFQQVDFGELAALEVIPDFALNTALFENSNVTPSIGLDQASVLGVLPLVHVKNDNKKPISQPNVEENKMPAKEASIVSNIPVETNSPEVVEQAPPIKIKKEVKPSQEIPANGFYAESFDLNQYDVDAGKIKKGQVIGKILSKHKVDYQQILKLSEKSKKVHDVRDINYNRKFMVLTRKNEDDVADYFVYEPDDYYYVVYDLNGDTEVTEVKRTIEKRIAQASGEIKYSLYQTMIDNNFNTELTYQISEVYAWTVDFYRINSGDKFKVIYEEEFINGKSVGIGTIMAAWFEYDGSPYYSFQYEQDNLFDYYDTEGNSLRKQFLKAPLRYNRISSRFTRKRYHPVLKRNKSHLGTDYAAPPGTPIHSVGDGKVVEARYAKYNGRFVKIRHNGIYSTQYLHMSKIEKGIAVGKEVKQGDVIGYVGSSGLASGPHLCFRFWKNGKQVDPFKQALPPSKPVNGKNMAEYQTVINKWKPILDGMHINGAPVATSSSSNDNNLN